MRLILLLIPLLIMADDLSQINKDIQNTQKQKQDIDREKQNLNLKLNTLGQNIISNVNQVKQLDSEIKNLAKNIESNKDQNKKQEERLKAMQDKLVELNLKREKKSEELSMLILRYMTFSRVLDDEMAMDMNDVMSRESFKVLKQQTTLNINEIEKQKKKITSDMDSIAKSISEINKMINTQETRAKNLQDMIERQNSLVENMRSEVKVYNQRLRDIDNQRKEMDKLLSALNISKKNKQDEIRRQKEQERLAKQQAERLEKLEKERLAKLEEEKKRAQAQKEAAQKKAMQEAEKIAKTDSKKAQEFLGKQNKTIEQEYNARISASEAKSAISDFENLRRVDSVYQKPETARYTGKRTLSPLDSYIIDQAFGDYIDPAYKIKIFNNGVVLKSKKSDAQVYSIMDGKVIYAQEMPGLKKVVVIEHANSMHSIYSMLDKIAPTLKPGFVVKQGYVIGRIADKLNLEIVQAGKHINPTEVIARR